MLVPLQPMPFFQGVYCAAWSRGAEKPELSSLWSLAAEQNYLLSDNFIFPSVHTGEGIDPPAQKSKEL